MFDAAATQSAYTHTYISFSSLLKQLKIDLYSYRIL